MARSLSTPCTRSSPSTTAIACHPRQAGAARVIAGAVVTPHVVEQLVIGLDMAAGQAFFRNELLQRARGEHPPALATPPNRGARRIELCGFVPDQGNVLALCSLR
jgi:hypothetical protein